MFFKKSIFFSLFLGFLCGQLQIINCIPNESYFIKIKEQFDNCKINYHEYLECYAKTLIDATQNNDFGELQFIWKMIKKHLEPIDRITLFSNKNNPILFNFIVSSPNTDIIKLFFEELLDTFTELYNTDGCNMYYDFIYNLFNTRYTKDSFKFVKQKSLLNNEYTILSAVLERKRFLIAEYLLDNISKILFYKTTLLLYQYYTIKAKPTKTGVREIYEAINQAKNLAEELHSALNQCTKNDKLILKINNLLSNVKELYLNSKELYDQLYNNVNNTPEAIVQPQEEEFKETLTTWIEKCSKCQETAIPKKNLAQANLTTIISFEDNKKLLNYFKNLMLFKIQVGLPYTQKLIVPAKSHICFIGDIHGSIHSENRNLNEFKSLGYIDDNFKLIDKDGIPTYMIFTGDFIDRGAFSVEVLYLLILLKINNPDRVFLIKGNHEDPEAFMRYGFYNELQVKYPEHYIELSNLYVDIFKLLPLAIYLGVTKNDKTTFTQCCHGGIGFLYDPRNFLMDQQRIYDTIPSKPIDFKKSLKDEQTDLGEASGDDYEIERGFTWSDFDSEDRAKDVIHEQRDGNKLVYDWRRRSIIASEAAVKKYLQWFNNTPTNNIILKAFFRGHQHSAFGLKIGGNKYWLNVVSLEDAQHENGFPIEKYGTVFTFSTAREGVGLPYDCFCILTTDDDYENWRLKPYERLAPAI